MCLTHHNVLLLCRLRMVAGRDGLLPTFFSGIHNKYVTPVPALLLQVSV